MDVGWSKEISHLLVHPSRAADEPGKAAASSQQGWHRAAGDILASFATHAAAYRASARGAEAKVPSRLGKGKMAALPHQEPWPHTPPDTASSLDSPGLCQPAAVSAMWPRASVTPRQALLGTLVLPLSHSVS